jgi:hypothetical protein
MIASVSTVSPQSLCQMTNVRRLGCRHALAGFDAIDGAFSDVNIEEQTDDALQLWLGVCCAYCTPLPLRVRFAGVTTVLGLDNED